MVKIEQIYSDFSLIIPLKQTIFFIFISFDNLDILKVFESKWQTFRSFLVYKLGMFCLK